MRIDYRRLERDIPEIAAQVEAVSGLRVPLDDLHFEVVRYGRCQAEYFFAERKIYAYQNKIPRLCSQNEANTILGHELMHHAQYSIEPFRQVVENVSYQDQYQDQLRSLNRIIEGDAIWAQFELERFYPSDVLSHISGFPLKMALEYAGVFHVRGGAADRYGLGRRRINALVAEGGRDAVNRLYQAGLQEIEQNFSDSIIEESITPGEENFVLTVEKIGCKVNNSLYRIERAYEEAINVLKKK